ncbi:uncharacterized protein BDR25DRAFT_348406 [Lindgomyces ingoldianus]|uniref:Uncharacterized protein n=1 Tax=Lindgomyces ingoldianus TaxID=673940 RepID=A0ACB6RFQ6_9PLEO|nr:uncharacterized protein BDR25DRAFT_348406 [Lindgomyces ingoldianus]KAF2478123.1 hypothetical protein BDR25DRAFT_348406 [Lindgomyces ingoldianus]
MRRAISTPTVSTTPHTAPSASSSASISATTDSNSLAVQGLPNRAVGPSVLVDPATQHHGVIVAGSYGLRAHWRNVTAQGRLWYPASKPPFSTRTPHLPFTRTSHAPILDIFTRAANFNDAVTLQTDFFTGLLRRGIREQPNCWREPPHRYNLYGRLKICVEDARIALATRSHPLWTSVADFPPTSPKTAPGQSERHRRLETSAAGAWKNCNECESDMEEVGWIVDLELHPETTFWKWFYAYLRRRFRIQSLDSRSAENTIINFRRYHSDKEPPTKRYWMHSLPVTYSSSFDRVNLTLSHLQSSFTVLWGIIEDSNFVYIHTGSGMRLMQGVTEAEKSAFRCPYGLVVGGMISPDFVTLDTKLLKFSNQPGQFNSDGQFPRHGTNAIKYYNPPCYPHTSSTYLQHHSFRNTQSYRYWSAT